MKPSFTRCSQKIMNNVKLNPMGLAKSTEITFMTNHVGFAKHTGFTRTKRLQKKTNKT